MRKFRDRATKLLRSKEAVLITRHGKEAGVYIPFEEVDRLSPEIRWKLFDELSKEIARQMKKKGLTEESFLEGFKRFRKSRGRQ